MDLDRIRKITGTLLVPPGTDLVEIINITHLDGTELEPDNWRRQLIGEKTTCCFIGGFYARQPVFRYMFYENDGKIDVDFGYEGNGSISSAIPMEVAPNVFTFETQTSIYHFRLLENEEVEKILEHVEEVQQKAYDAMLSKLGDQTLKFN